MLDSLLQIDDVDGNGFYESLLIFSDVGAEDIWSSLEIFSEYDLRGEAEIITDFYDMSEDIELDAVDYDEGIDIDRDPTPETSIVTMDVEKDEIFDQMESYPAELEEIWDVDRLKLGLPCFNPNDSSMDYENDIVGDPAASMEYWRFQGDTNRCALYSQLFIIEDLTGQDIDIEEFAEIAQANGWFCEDNGTSPSHLDTMLDYYGIEHETGYNGTLDSLRDALEEGKRIIVTVDSGEIWYDKASELFWPGFDADHAVQVIGIDNTDPINPMIILNDSGSPEGCGEMVPAIQFYEAWEDGGCQYVFI